MESASLLNKQEEARSPSSFTRGVLLSTSVAVAGSFCYGCAMSYTSPAQSKIMEELGLSVADYSFFTSLMTLGGMITAALSGKIAALTGRRQTMWISDVCCIFGWLAVAFAHNIMLLSIGRLFLGFGVGLISYVKSHPKHFGEDSVLLISFYNVLEFRSCSSPEIFSIGEH